MQAVFVKNSWGQNHMFEKMFHGFMDECTLREKPAITMNLNEFITAINSERLSNPEIRQALLEKGFFGMVTPEIVKQLKPGTFGRFGKLTLEGEIDIFRDLKKVGLSKNAKIKDYMTHAVQFIRSTSIARK